MSSNFHNAAVGVAARFVWSNQPPGVTAQERRATQARLRLEAWKQAELKPKREGEKKEEAHAAAACPLTRPCLLRPHWCYARAQAEAASPARASRTVKTPGRAGGPPPKNRRLSASTFPCSPRLGIVGAKTAATRALSLPLRNTTPPPPRSFDRSASLSDAAVT